MSDMKTVGQAHRTRRSLLLARLFLVLVLAMLGSAAVGTDGASAGVGTVSLQGVVAYTGGDGVALRYAPTATGKIQPLIVWGDGHAAPVICQAWSSDGSAVGPNVNRIFDKVAFAGYAGDTWIPDAYVMGTAPYANQFAPNVPRCGAPPPSSDTRVWFGAPFRGQWVPINYDCTATSAFPSSCSRPAVHHWLSTTAAPAGDWAVDLGAPAGTSVVVYAAPQNTAMPLTARVDRIAPACSSGRVADGGYAVTVAVYNQATRIGSATYAHIQPAQGLAVGQAISRWGGVVGIVGSYQRGSCWDGPHTHFQLYSQSNYACYNKGWVDRQWMNPSNFLGFTGGNVATGPRQHCA